MDVMLRMKIDEDADFDEWGGARMGKKISKRRPDVVRIYAHKRKEKPNNQGLIFF